MSLLQAPKRQLLGRLPRACARLECLQQRRHELQPSTLRSTGRRLMSITSTRSYASRPPNEKKKGIPQPDDQGTVIPAKHIKIDSASRVRFLQKAKGRKDEAIKAMNKAEKEKEYQKRYKSAARKWTASIIAMPILLVTSYHLFDRLVMGTKQKEMPGKGGEFGGLPLPR